MGGMNYQNPPPHPHDNTAPRSIAECQRINQKQPTSELLPPFPKRLEVITVLTFAAAGLVAVDAMEKWWGIESRWSWFPYSTIGLSLFLALRFYEWRFTQRPFGPYADQSLRHRLSVILAGVAVFAALAALAAT